MEYEKFLEVAQEMFEIAKKDKMYNKEVGEMKIDLSEGLVLARKINSKDFIVVKVGIGTQEELRQIFHESE